MDDPGSTIRAIGQLDPTDEERLVTSWGESRAKQDLLDLIVGGGDQLPESPRRPGRRTVALAAAAVGVAAALAVVPGLLSGSSGRAFAVRQLPNGVVEIEMSSRMQDGRALAAELREYGIETDIELVTASPSMVGQVEVFNQTGGDYIPEGMTLPPDGSDTWVMTIDPDVFRERLTIRIAVEPEAGRPYSMAAEVFSPGEVLGGLHCALGEPVRAVDLVPYLDRLGLEAVWNVVQPTDDPSVSQHEPVEQVPDGEVLSGYAVDASTVSFDVVLDGVTLGPGWGSTPLSHEPCTDEQASRWR